MLRKSLAVVFTAGMLLGFGASADAACKSSRTGSEPIHVANPATGGFIYANGSANGGYVGVSGAGSDYGEIRGGTDGSVYFHGSHSAVGSGRFGVVGAAPTTACP